MKQRQDLNWTVGWSDDIDAQPAEMVAAVVPGAVQLDWARAHGWPDYTYADNWREYRWMEDVYWTYRTKLAILEAGKDEQICLVCGGVDYKFLVRINDRVVHRQEGMFTPSELDLTRVSSGDILEIVIYPAPKSQLEHDDRSQANQSCKPAASYGWDWHPRLIPLGIWEDTYIEVRSRHRLRHAETFYDLSDDFLTANLRVNTHFGDDFSGRLQWTVTDDAGDIQLSASTEITSAVEKLNGTIDAPRLWWPNGEGEAVLYTSRLELFGDDGRLLDTRTQRIGFRRVRLIEHPGTWGEPSEFPKSRSNPPITLEINGRPIFGKGSNWVNEGIFPGVMNAESYRRLLERAHQANFNLLRIWGGGPANKESFFDICDEMGLLVWQEFPLACNNYLGTPEYLKVLDQESRSIILRLRQHPSLAIWCGGNELFNAWSRMTDQSPALRLLAANCYNMDPKTPFLMTSPVEGMGHGNYVFRDSAGKEVFQMFRNASCTAYTEFGCPGPSPVDYLKTFIPEEDLFPPRPGTAWETHHAFNAWVGPTWLELPTIEAYFGPSPNLETLVERGTWLQVEGYKCLFEEARRQKPRCSMALNWCFNEPWPTAANNSLISWPCEPKPAYHAVASACRVSLASARVSKFSWREGDVFSPELWILHDDPNPLASGRLVASIEFGGSETVLLNWDFPEIAPSVNLPGPILRFMLPHAGADRISLILRVEGRPDLDSRYDLLYTPSHSAVEPTAHAPTMNI